MSRPAAALLALCGALAAGGETRAQGDASRRSVEGTAAAAAPFRATCLFERGPRLAEALLADGTRVEVYSSHIRVGGRVVSPCDGLPAPHPTSVATFGDGFAVGFRSGGAHLWSDGRFTRIPGEMPGGVRSLASDGESLWIGTVAGLFRYSAGRLERVRHGRLGRRVITALAVEPGGTVHAGVDPRGHFRLAPGRSWAPVDGRTLVGCFATRGGGLRPEPPGPSCHGPADESALPSGHVTAMAVHDGALFVGTFDGGLLRRAAGGEIARVEGAPLWVNTLLSDGETLWIGSPGGLFARDRSGSVRRVEVGLPSEHVNGLHRASSGELWIATGAGLVGWDGARMRLLDDRNGLPSRIVYAVTETDDGALWVGTAEGVARLDRAGLTLYQRAGRRLPHDWVTSILAERGGTVLVGTYDSGLAQLGPGGRSETVAGLGPIWVNPHGIAPTRDGIAIATLGDGLWTVDRRGARRHDALPSNDVTAAVEHDGALWVGTRAGLARLELER